jgi:hypothetical protein
MTDNANIGENASLSKPRYVLYTVGKKENQLT